MRLPSRPAGLLALMGALVLAPSAPAVAATIGVNTTTDETVSDSHCSLREAISAANGDSKGPGGDCAKGSGADTVELPKGHFTLDIEFPGDDSNDFGDLDIRSTVTIAGAGAGATTTDAKGIDRVRRETWDIASSPPGEGGIMRCSIQHMLTVPEAARRVGRNPETIRRWIRAGRLRARKVGTQHVIEEADLERIATPADALPVPDALLRFDSGRVQPDWAEAIHRSRRAR
jgi:CSLREA domain-containing protein/excisionase family DNA binding protein